MCKEKIIKSLIALSGFSNILLEISSKYNSIALNSFLKHSVKKNTILVTDPIVTHGEVMPGIIKYCFDLGYNVEALITSDKMSEKPLTMFKNLKVFSINSSDYGKAIESDKIKEYKKVIFTTSRVYYNYPRLKNELVFDYYKNCKIENPILIEHHLDALNENEKFKYKFASLPFFSKDYNIAMINPHYFGEFKTKSKNKKTKFVVAGSIETERKNHNLLLESALSLLKKGIQNFEITVIGRGFLNIENVLLKKKIKFLGRLTYKKMYEVINSSDYILALFDPKNSLHDRYLKDGTSGTFQLSYGFLKPLIINDKFASIHHLDNKNAIIYKNEELAQAMEFAINEPEKSYKDRVENLEKLEKEIYIESLNNLEDLIAT